MHYLEPIGRHALTLKLPHRISHHAGLRLSHMDALRTRQRLAPGLLNIVQKPVSDKGSTDKIPYLLMSYLLSQMSFSGSKTTKHITIDRVLSYSRRCQHERGGLTDHVDDVELWRHDGIVLIDQE